MNKKITILGAGNMGHILAAKFSKDNDVCVYLNEVERTKPFFKNVKVLCEDSGLTYEGKVKLITTDLKEAVEFGDYFFITYPAFLFESFAKTLCPLLGKGKHLVFVPGSGGADLWFKDAVNRGATITGLQRVHSVARIITQGELVKESGIRDHLKIASIPNSYNKEACSIISELYSLPVEPLDNYLNVTLVNSNPILHTSRLYSIFKDYPKKIKSCESLPLFYEEWDLETSMLLNKMDKELFSLFDALGKYNLPVRQIMPLLTHYDSTTELEMTKKLNSINSLKGLTTPNVVNEEGKYLPDLKSRYFTADFPYGLDILIAFLEFFNVNADNMKMVSDWYHDVIKDSRKFSLKNFFVSKEEMIKYYY